MDGVDVIGKRKRNPAAKTLAPLNLEEAKGRAPWLKSLERLELRVRPTLSGAPSMVGGLNNGTALLFLERRAMALQGGVDHLAPTNGWATGVI